MRVMLCVSASILGCAAAIAQTSPPSNAPGTKNNLPIFWTPGASVTVYIDGNSFPAGSISQFAIMNGFSNNASAYGSQGVTYSFSTVTDPPLQNNNSVWVTTASFSNPGQYGENATVPDYSAAGSYGYNTVQSATIGATADLINYPNGLTYAISHEDSHDYGLGDCEECDEGSTIMTYNIDISDPTIEGPTGSDVSAFSDFGGGSGGTGDQGCSNSHGGPCPVQDQTGPPRLD